MFSEIWNVLLHIMQIGLLIKMICSMYTKSLYQGHAMPDDLVY